MTLQLPKKIWFIPFTLIAISLACSFPKRSQPTLDAPPKSGDVELFAEETRISPTLPPPTPTPQSLPPTLIEIDPPQGSRLPTSGVVTLYFNQPMDRPAVEMAFAGEPALSGRFEWLDDASVVFRPDAPLPSDSDIRIQLDTNTLASNGQFLQEPVSIHYRTAPSLKAVQVLPEPGLQDIDPTSAVVVTFNQPVVALGADPATLPKAFSITPEASGRAEWVNTSTYIFYPETAFLGGVSYTVRLNDQLTSTAGATFVGREIFEDNAFEWTFSTAYPRLISLDPSNGAGAVRLDSVFRAEFSQPMDIASVAANFTLYDPNQQAISGEYGWNEAFTTLTFTPTQTLKRNSSYNIFLLGASQALGGTPLDIDTVARVQTVPVLDIRSTEPVNEGVKGQFASVVLHFNGPVSPENPLNYIQFLPEVPNLNHWWDEYNRSLSINGDFEALSVYTVTVSADFPDPWGGSLGEPYTFHFQTAALDPSILIAHGETTLFLTPEDTTITAQIANIDRIGLRLGTVPLDNLLTFMAPGGYDALQNFRPADQQSWTYEAGLPGDRSYVHQFPITPGGEALTPGIYHLGFLIPELAYQLSPYLLISSNVQLSFKMSTTSAFVWAVDLRTNQPVSGATVLVYDNLGNRITSGVTDSQGVFQSPIPTQPDLYSTYYAVLNDPGNDLFSLALSNWSQGIEGYDFGFNTDFNAPALTAYLYTDRPIYRPGQTVYFRAVVRHAHNGRYALPDLGNLAVTVYDRDFAPAASLDLPLSAFGTAHGQYALPEDAQPGYYQFSSEYGSVAFHVAEYRKPEIELKIETDATDLIAGEFATAQVSARYYFDAPAANTPIQWSIYRVPTQFQVPGYSVGSDNLRWLDPPWRQYSGLFGEFVSSGEGLTDSDGLLALEFSTSPEADSPYLYTLEVTISDESGYPVSARTGVSAHPSDFYIGVRPDFWTGQAGREMGFEIFTVGWDQQPAGERVLQALFQKVTWERQDSPNPFDYPIFTPRYETVSSADFKTAPDGLAQLAFTPPEAGTYQLAIDDGRTRTQVLVWVGGQGQAVWPNLPNNRLRLTVDGEAYSPGETANIFIPNPFDATAQALITIERDEVLRYEVLTLDTNGLSYPLALSDSDAPNIYVSVTVIGLGEDGKPDFRQGYLNLDVQPVAQKLTVELIASNPSGDSKFAPQDEVNFKVRVTDSNGNPVRGEFSLAVVDKAALALADPNAVDILSAFYGQQPLGVRTGMSLVVYAHRQTNVPGGLGGGGEDQAYILRQDFPDTAYWNAEIVTDGNGQAEISIPLPDNLTTWAVDLRGLTEDTQIGEARTEIVTSRDLLVRPVTPRFLVAGDHVQLAALVHNNTLDELQVDVSLEAAGFTLDDGAAQSQQVSIPAGGRARVGWWGTVEDVESLDPIFLAVGSPSTGQALYQDASLTPLGIIPVLHFNAAQTFGTAGILDLEGQRLEVISLPRTFDPTGGTLTVELAPSLAAAMTAGFEVLEYYPYECTEQTLSRFLPNLMAYRAIQDLGLDSLDLLSRLERTLDTGIQELVARQNEDGGWGWWTRPLAPGSSLDGGEEPEISDDYISAYVVFGLSEARDAGVFVDDVVIENGINYLLATTPGLEMLSSTWQLDRLAFHYFALSQAGAGSPGMPRNLFEARDQLSPWAKALLALTLKTHDPADERVATLFSDLETAAIRNATGIHWEGNQIKANLDTPIFNTAVAIYAIAQHDPTSFTIPEAVRYLMAARRADGSWGSTYETAWALMALTEVMKNTGELAGDYGFSATLNGSPLLAGQAGGDARLNPVNASVPVSDLYPAAPNGLILQRTGGPGRLYYSAHLNVVQPVESVGAANRGIAVSRAYQTEDGRPDSPVLGPRSSVSELVTVKVSITLENDAYYLVVEDYIPAGAEILDLNLKTSQQGAADFNVRSPFAEGWGWWYFNDPLIFDDHIAWSADFAPAGTYELTYTLVLNQSGEYRVIPAQAWEFYFPEVRGNSAGEVFRIEE